MAKHLSALRVGSHAYADELLALTALGRPARELPPLMLSVVPPAAHESTARRTKTQPRRSKTMTENPETLAAAHKLADQLAGLLKYLTQQESDQVLARVVGTDNLRAANAALAVAAPQPVPEGDGIPLATYTKLLHADALAEYGSDAVLAFINAAMREVALVGGNPLEATYQLSGAPEGVLLEVEAVVQA